MKYLITILLIVISYNSFSQESSTLRNPHETLITLNAIDKTLEEVFIEIEGKSRYKFFYLKNWLPSTKLNMSYEQVKIEDLLNSLLSQTYLNYFIHDDSKIIITKHNAIVDKIPETDISITFNDYEIVEDITIKEENSNSAEVETGIVNESKVIEPILNVGKENIQEIQSTFTIQGYVRNKNTNVPIPNAAIVVRGENIGTSTNSNGHYSLQLNKGAFVLQVSSLTTKDIRRRIRVFNDGEVDFYLEENIEVLEEVFLLAEVDRNVREVSTGVTKIEVERIKNIPLVLGERDILKVATTLPGISNTGEGSNGYNVRGGKTDQNLILLDNAAIYNPSHFFGFFSALNPFTTGDVSIYKGNIPAKFGGRLSSVFDISSKEASVEKFSGEVSIGPVTGNVVMEFPVNKNKSGLMVGGRSTYSDWILKNLDEESLMNSEATFYDAIVKYNHKITDNSSIKTTAYYSKDRFSITSDSLYSYSNRLLSFGWDHKINDKHRLILSLTNSEYQFNIEYDGSFSNDFDLNYKNNETELKARLDWEYDGGKHFTYGLSSKLYNIHPGELQPLNATSQIEDVSINKERGLESAIFASMLFELDDKFALDIGGRYSLFNSLGGATRNYEIGIPLSEATLISVEENGDNEFVDTYHGLEGRISVRYFIADDFSVKASFNNTFQYIHTLSTNTTISPTDTWKLSDNNIEPQKAQQISLGFYKNIEDNLYELSLEGYYKNYNNILDYKVGAQLLLNETLETQVLQGKGRSYGVELLIKKNAGKGRWNGWLGYTYARTEFKLDSEFSEERVNRGDYFPANYDKPHDFSAVLNYKLTQRFSFSGNFAYQTGRPITYPVGTYMFGGAEYTLYSDRNKFRIPDYYRLDVGFNYEGNHKIKKFVHSFWNLSIYNVLGRNNPYSVFFVTEDGEIKALQSSIFSIPIPTITFNFKF